MHICLASLHPRLLSGQIDSLAALARALRTRGHDVSVASAFADADVLDPGRAFGAAAEPGQLAPRLVRLQQVWRTIEREAAAADLVQLNLPTPSFTILANLLQVRVKRPVIVGFEAHLPRLGEAIRHCRPGAAPRFYLPRLLVNNPLIARLTGFHAAHYVVASQYQVDELIRLGAPADRISAIPNLYDWHRLAAEGQAGLEQLPPGEPLLGYVGHFNHVKGVDVLVRAFPLVQKAYPNARLVLAWSGLGDPEPIRRAIAATGLADRIHLVGRVSVAALLRRSDVCVLPYRLTIGQAAFPGLVLEALGVGVPLVTSDLPLLRELVAPDRLAALARPEDPVDLAGQIRGLLDDPAAATRMVARQRRAIATYLSPTVLVRRFEDLYERILASTTAGQAHVLRSAERRRRVRSTAIR